MDKKKKVGFTTWMSIRTFVKLVGPDSLNSTLACI